MYTEKPKESTLKTFRTNILVQQSCRIKVNTKIIVYLYTCNEYSENKIKKTIPLK